jgi:nitronate monooxygenase
MGSVMTPAAHTLMQRLGLALPIWQAPMAGVQGHALAVAVSEAGGLGALPAAMLSPEALHRELVALRAGTQQPFNLNFFCHTPPEPDAVREAAWRAALLPHYQALGLDAQAVQAAPTRRPFDAEAAGWVEAHRPAVVSFHFGLPAPALLARVKATGAWVCSSATTVAEARWLEAHGMDAVIAQGLEAGGHRGMFLGNERCADGGFDLSTQLGTMALLPQVCRAVACPVIAAGGIADAQGVAAALALGASAVQLGTAYLLCPEAQTSAVHRAALKSDAAQHTALTPVFSGRPARGIVNGLMRALAGRSDLPPAFPLASAALAPLRACAEAQGSGDYSPLWCGQNASGCCELPAFDLTRRLAGLV